MFCQEPVPGLLWTVNVVLSLLKMLLTPANYTKERFLQMLTGNAKRQCLQTATYRKATGCGDDVCGCTAWLSQVALSSHSPVNTGCCSPLPLLFSICVNPQVWLTAASREVSVLPGTYLQASACLYWAKIGLVTKGTTIKDCCLVPTGSANVPQAVVPSTG